MSWRYSCIKFSSGKCYCVDVELSDTIENVKVKILDMEGWPVDRKCLIWRNIILEDWRSLWDYFFIQRHSTLYLTFKGPGEKKAPFPQDHLNDITFTFIRDALVTINSQLADRWVFAYWCLLFHSHLPYQAGSFVNQTCDIVRNAYPGHMLPKVWKYCEPVTSVVRRSKFVSHKDVLRWAAICDPSNMVKTFTSTEIVVSTAVTQRGVALRHADPTLKGNPKIVLAAVTQDGRALRYADMTLKANKKIVLAAVTQCGLALSLADPTLKANLEIVLAAVTQDGRVLKYAHSTFKVNPKVVFVAVTQDGRALEYADPALRSNPKIVLAAVTQCGLALSLADPALKANPEIASAAVAQDGLTLESSHM